MNIWGTLIAIVALAAVTLAIVMALRLEHPWLQPWAIARATLQLGILTLILNSVIQYYLWVVLFLFVMVSAATWVVFRRLSLPARYLPVLAGTIIVAAAIPTVLVFLSGAVDFAPRYVLAVGGIIVGNAMTVCTLMGRSLASLIVSQRDEIEGWLSIGATARRATRRAIRSAGSTALIPMTDQTRTTGLVTLPGSFVGAVFAGASPLVAAEFQLIVLAAVLATGAIAVALFSFVFGAPEVLPISDSPLGGRAIRPTER